MALPVDYQTCRITAHYVNLLGVPAAGTVTFTARANRIVSPATQTVVLPTPITVQVDIGGQIDLPLPATDDPDISPQGFTYQVVEVLDGGYMRYDIEAPVGGHVDLSTVVVAASTSGQTIIQGPPGEDGGTLPGGGSVDSVTGNVVDNTDAANPVVDADPPGSAATALSDAQQIINALNATDVGADPAGTATGAVGAHAGATDPHADRAYADQLIVALGTAANADVSDFATAAQGVDARTPTAHAATHEYGGTDTVDIDTRQLVGPPIAPAQLGTGTASASTVLHGDKVYREPAGGGGGGVPVMARTVGLWYGPEGHVSSGGAWAVAAAPRASLIPVWLHAGSIDRLAIIVEGTGGVATWVIGLYPADPATMLPDGLAEITKSADLDMSVAGRREAVVAATLPYSGIYWTCAAVVASTTPPNTRRFDEAASVGLVIPYLGAPTGMDPGATGAVTLAARRTSYALDGVACPATIPFQGGPKIAVRYA